MVSRDLYIFNPTCETAIANGSETFMASRILRELEDDLALLPMIFTSPEDYVISPYAPPERFIRQLEEAGFPVSKWAAKAEIEKDNTLEFSRIIPWGWSPAVHFQLKEIKEKVSGDFTNSKVFHWNPLHKTLFERKTSAEILSRFLDKYGTEQYCRKQAVPQLVRSEEDIRNYIEKCSDCVIKSPLSSSGRGVQMVHHGSLSRSAMQWAGAVLKQSGYLMAEPFHHKKQDLSFQFEIDSAGKVVYHGPVLFFTTGNGMYQGHYLNRNISEFVGEDFSRLTEKTGNRLRKILEESVYAQWYEGFLGVDGMVIEEKGQLKIHPCLEINSRLTMGMVALKIEKLIHPQAKGRFEVFSGKAGDFSAFSEEMKLSNPVRLKDNLFYSGFVALTPPFSSAKFGAYVLLY